MAESVSSLSEDRIAYLERLVTQGKTAAAVFTQFTQSEVDRIVKAMVLAGLGQAQYLARLAIEETRLGVLEDKAIKNMVATEFVYNYVRDKPSVGVIREFPERGLAEVAEPVGLIFSITPITNPTSTVLFKCIMAIKTRNAVIFGPHPKAWRCCQEAIRIMYEAAVKYGAPEGVFTCLESPTIPDNNYLMRHKDVRLIDATGGPGAVKAAYSSGKPALGVGPGNTPVYLEKTAHLDMAVVDIITSKTFDNGTICASEQTVVIDDEIYDLAIQKFADLGAHICDEKETRILGRTVIDPDTGFMQPMAIGQKATDIARTCGIRVPPDTKLLIAPIQGVGPEHPLSVEKLFPVLAVYRAASVDEALRVCVDVNHAGGLGHTAVIFSRNEEIIQKFSEVINAGRIIVNSPGSIGALGGVYNDMVPTFSFGCGTGGGNSTTDNINLYHYLNIKRVARRTQAPIGQGTRWRPPPVAAITDLLSRGVDAVIGMQQHLLTLAARQTDEWIDATRSGEPFQGLQLTALARESMETFVRSQKKFLDVLAEETAYATGKDTPLKSHAAARKTELTELARQSAEAYIDAQKKLLDVAAQQLKVSAKTAKDAIGAMNFLPAETLGELARHTVEGLVESEQELLSLLVEPPHQPSKSHAAEAAPKPIRKRAAARRKAVAVNA